MCKLHKNIRRRKSEGDYASAGKRSDSLSIILILRMRKWLRFRCPTTVELAAYLYQITELPWAFLCKDESEITRLVLEVCALIKACLVGILGFVPQPTWCLNVARKLDDFCLAWQANGRCMCRLVEDLSLKRSQKQKTKLMILQGVDLKNALSLATWKSVFTCGSHPQFFSLWLRLHDYTVSILWIAATLAPFRRRLGWMLECRGEEAGKCNVGQHPSDTR
jgi:hypothetical protein